MFEWGPAQEDAFRILKQRIADATSLAYFRQGAPTKLITDASPVGLGAVLVQSQDGTDRALCYTSRALSDVERRYSQVEKEALAVVWACERIDLYLFGLPKFQHITDNKAAQFLFSPRSKPSARIERWVLRLMNYQYEVVHVPSAKNIADSLSRLSGKCRATSSVKNEDDQYIRTVAQLAVPAALSVQDIEDASADDEDLQVVRSCLKSGNWNNCHRDYAAVRHELTRIGKLVLRGTRLVIPAVLRADVLKLAHEEHQSIVKTKQRLRSKVWWPGMDNAAERKCRTCHGCQLVGQPSRPPPIESTPLPAGPWQELAIDLMGPLPTGETLLVVVDYLSRFVEVDILKSTTSDVIIRRLDTHFSRHGLLVGVRTDNGPQFVSSEFVKFLAEIGVLHRRTTPLWPRANGEVERQNRTLMKAIRIAHAEGKNWRLELNKFLLAYRSTPRSTTGISPADLLFRRPLRTKLPQVTDDTPLLDF